MLQHAWRRVSHSRGGEWRGTNAVATARGIVVVAARRSMTTLNTSSERWAGTPRPETRDGHPAEELPGAFALVHETATSIRVRREDGWQGWIPRSAVARFDESGLLQVAQWWLQGNPLPHYSDLEHVGRRREEYAELPAVPDEVVARSVVFAPCQPRVAGTLGWHTAQMRSECPRAFALAYHASLPDRSTMNQAVEAATRDVLYSFWQHVTDTTTPQRVVQQLVPPAWKRAQQQYHRRVRQVAWFDVYRSSDVLERAVWCIEQALAFVAGAASAYDVQVPIKGIQVASQAPHVQHVQEVLHVTQDSVSDRIDMLLHHPVRGDTLVMLAAVGDPASAKRPLLQQDRRQALYLCELHRRVHGSLPRRAAVWYPASQDKYYFDVGAEDAVAAYHFVSTCISDLPDPATVLNNAWNDDALEDPPFETVHDDDLRAGVFATAPSASTASTAAAAILDDAMLDAAPARVHSVRCVTCAFKPWCTDMQRELRVDPHDRATHGKLSQLGPHGWWHGRRAVVDDDARLLGQPADAPVHPRQPRPHGTTSLGDESVEIRVAPGPAWRTAKVVGFGVAAVRLASITPGQEVQIVEGSVITDELSADNLTVAVEDPFAIVVDGAPPDVDAVAAAQARVSHNTRAALAGVYQATGNKHLDQHTEMVYDVENRRFVYPL